MNRRGKIYSPPWWLPGAHLQTIWGKVARKRRSLALTRRTVETPDGDEVELYTHEGDAGSPQLLLFHGLEGSLRSHYANGIVSSAADRGWTARVMLFRSCGAAVNRTRRFYHSGDTGDVRFMIERLVEESPDIRLFLVGVSLGGNVLLKYLGEASEKVPRNVIAAAALSVPYELGRSAERINRGFSRVYQRFFLTTLKAKLLEKRRAFPDLPNEEEIRKLRTMVEFDDLVTAPLHDFADAADYYEQSSAIRFVQGIRVPTLLLSSFDDPFLPPEVLAKVEAEAARNPALHIDFHQHGGHVGFVEGKFPWAAEYYADRRILDFFSEFIAEPE